MQTYFLEDKRIIEWVDLIIEKLLTFSLLKNEELSPKDVEEVSQAISNLSTLLQNTLSLSPEALTEVINQLIRQRLPEDKLMNHFTDFYEYLSQFLANNFTESNDPSLNDPSLFEGISAVPAFANTVTSANSQVSLSPDITPEITAEHKEENTSGSDNVYDTTPSMTISHCADVVLTAKEEIANNKITKEEAPKEETSKEEISKEEISKEEISKEETPKEKTPNEETQETPEKAAIEMTAIAGSSIIDSEIPRNRIPSIPTSGYDELNVKIPSADHTVMLKYILRRFYPQSKINWNIELAGYSFLAQVEDLLIYLGDCTGNVKDQLTQDLAAQGWTIFCCSEEDLRFPRRLERNIKAVLRSTKAKVSSR